MSIRLFICLFLLAIACTSPAPKLKYGAVTSASPEATEAGMRILKAGGNAVDAAIAVSFALGVSEPAMSGLGGGTQVQIYLPRTIRPFAINGSTLSPAATPTTFEKDSLHSHHRSTIPSTPKVMQYLFDHYGSQRVSWEQLIQPAIGLAEAGVTLGPFRTKVYQRYEQKLIQGTPHTADYIAMSSATAMPMKVTSTLKLIAGEGAEAFYSGAIATAIDEDMRANGGWITLADLASFPTPDSLQSVHFRHNGYDIYTQPEPCGGWVMGEILGELTRIRARNPNGDSLEQLVEAIHHGHDQRQLRAKGESSSQSGETTHFSAMDKDGLAVSVTSSINAYYGAGVANPEYGFLYNSYMDDFNFDEADNAYAIGPNKMAYSSMSPTIVMKEGQVVLVIGSPGSARIISTVAQIIDHYTSGTVAAEQLLALPRIHAINQRVYFESAEQEAYYNSLNNTRLEIVRANDYLARHGLNAYFGGVHAIVWTGRAYIALADPRRDGLALAE